MSGAQAGDEIRFRPENFKASADRMLRDTQRRESFQGAMHFLVERRAIHFSDLQSFETLRATGATIRQHALARLPELLETLESRLQALGVHVHWA